MTPELWEQDKFFDLPVARFDEYGITPMESRHQPTGFMDAAGVWVAILTPEGLKRARLG